MVVLIQYQLGDKENVRRTRRIHLLGGIKCTVDRVDGQDETVVSEMLIADSGLQVPATAKQRKGCCGIPAPSPQVKSLTAMNHVSAILTDFCLLNSLTRQRCQDK